MGRPGPPRTGTARAGQPPSLPARAPAMAAAAWLDEATRGLHGGALSRTSRARRWPQHVFRNVCGNCSQLRVGVCEQVWCVRSPRDPHRTPQRWCCNAHCRLHRGGDNQQPQRHGSTARRCTQSCTACCGLSMCSERCSTTVPSSASVFANMSVVCCCHPPPDSTKVVLQRPLPIPQGRRQPAAAWESWTRFRAAFAAVLSVMRVVGLSMCSEQCSRTVPSSVSVFANMSVVCCVLLSSPARLH